MKLPFFRPRVYASILILGSIILLYRTISMMTIEHAFEILVLWVVALLIAEFFIDFACLLTSMKWVMSNDILHARLPLKLGAAAAILHAVRVIIYVLGRTGPWVNFDVKPEFHDSYTFEWFWVYFAAILSALGLVGVLVIWQVIRRGIPQSKSTSEA